ncbi:MAG: hypothetical protein ACK4N5_16570, partial [Myxococcales bacterium]
IAALLSGVQHPYGLAGGTRPGGGARLYVAAFAGFTVDVIDIPDLSRPRSAVLLRRLGRGAEVPFEGQQ